MWRTQTELIMTAWIFALGVATFAPSDSVPLYTNLGNHHFAISSRVPRVQQYFDQGIRLAYGFNHEEAIRSFREAGRLDPRCAICWWGVAYSYGPNINLPMDSASGAAAWDALQKARALAGNASPKEQAYIRALGTRYAASPGNRAQQDSAYARSMQELARTYPADLDAAALAAEAMMDLRPWNYWMKDGAPYPGTTELLTSLERVLRANPDHPGACHFYIHAVEAAHPEKAVRCAERLASLMPGAGHIVHMPAHIYIRVGRWNDAIEANQHAVHADMSYIADQRPGTFYTLAYYPHNHHFLAFAAGMAGRSGLAIEHARHARRNTPEEVAKGVPPLQPLIAYPHLALVTFGRWDDVLREPGIPADLRVATALIAYARGVAQAAKRNEAEARRELDTLNAIARTMTEEPFKTMLAIAQHALMGEIALRASQLPQAEQHFRVAMGLEDSMNYIEPPDWYYPIRHSLGVVLLRANRPADAEQLYREDLKRFPENGWSLYGLAASLRAQGKSAEAAQIDARFKKAWEQSDVRVNASRY
jgi:tetratricopeptide (TPR) repeat protein